MSVNIRIQSALTEPQVEPEQVNGSLSTNGPRDAALLMFTDVQPLLRSSHSYSMGAQ
ncbi:hypothetical protein CHARACLAT_028299 [Characodon lateralis]|uniref:Uncharacterized protein n=1 Tax=Characodon lateralis TaxID=208331 RepID=A0ABU7EXW9_9TELE|nr:hypothetical protein [Characodon lateralis]